MIITRTPLRISFVGGGTDLPGFYRHYSGMVISTAINKYIYVIVKKRFDERIYVGYSKKEIVDTVDEIEHDLVREAMKLTGVISGVEIVTLADIPSFGSGLGSSSALTVGLLHALYAYLGKPVEPEQLAREACRIEIDILGKPIGKQDQYITAYGGLRQIVFYPDEYVSCKIIEPDGVTKKKLGDCLMLFYTGIARSAEDVLREQNVETKETSAILKRMKEQVLELRDVLLKSKLEQLGTILNEAWSMKKRLACGITNSRIDSLYQRAMKVGAWGGKISGAGGGGFLLLYCPQERQEAVRAVMPACRELKFSLEGSGSTLIFKDSEE